MIDYSAGTYTAGTYIFYATAALALIALAVGIFGFFRWPTATVADTGLALAAIALATLVAATIKYWPLDTTYHQWYPVTGTVATTDSRIIKDGHSVTQRIVVRFAETGDLYGCDDTRCAAAVQGDHLTLRCKREWQYQATPDGPAVTAAKPRAGTDAVHTAARHPGATSPATRTPAVARFR